MKPSCSVPSIRELLIKIHRDLFTIESHISIWHYEGDLSILEKVVLVLEDRRFLRHRGVDLRACLRELIKCLSWKKHGGASTIDMQFVRTATGYRELTLRRKIYEVALSCLIQFRYSKIRILRSYLNCAFFGSGMVGINAAAGRHFQKLPDELDMKEAAVLAAMLVYPRPLVPNGRWRTRVERRAEYGLRQMVRLKESFEKIPS